MRPIQSRLMSLALAAGLLLPAAAFAAKLKTYQLTGKVVGFDDKIITIEKGDEKTEFERTANTKITGTLKVGEKITIEYKMVAEEAEVKK